MVLLESIRKKAILLNNTCKQLNLSAQVVCERAEYYSAHSTKNFDIVVARAVSVMDHLWRWSTTVLKPSGYLMAMKGGDCTREFEWLKKQNLDFRQITTPDSWRSFSSYLETKYIIAVKKADNMRR